MHSESVFHQSIFFSQLFPTLVINDMFFASKACITIKYLGKSHLLDVK